MQPRNSVIASNFWGLRSGPARASNSACTRPWCAKIPPSPRSWTSNAVTVDAEGMAPITLVGPGAGGMATASAVVSDIADIARGVRGPPFGRATSKLTVSRKAPMQRHEGGYYIRLMAVDKPGTAATIAKRLAQQHISIESIVQRHPGPQGGDVPKRTAPVPVILITYATTEDAVRKALAAVKRDRVISGKPQLIRIEKN